MHRMELKYVAFLGNTGQASIYRQQKMIMGSSRVIGLTLVHSLVEKGIKIGEEVKFSVKKQSVGCILRTKRRSVRAACKRERQGAAREI